MPQDLSLRLVHLASLHCGEPLYRPQLLTLALDRIQAIAPDVVVVAGDLTAAGYEWEYAEALEHLDRLDAPRVVVPGNHDARNVGYVHFEQLVGPRFSRWRLPFDDRRAERLGLTGLTVIGLDSSEPDLDLGHVGRERYDWIREQCSDPDDLKVVVLHHHLVPIPGAGRDISHISDTGDLLPVLDELGIDIVLTGHRHVPYFWGLNGMLLANAGTVSTDRHRGRVPSSWHELVIDAASIKVFSHYEDGTRDLSVVRSRGSRQTVRQGFHVSEAFLRSNSLPVS